MLLRLIRNKCMTYRTQGHEVILNNQQLTWDMLLNKIFVRVEDNRYHSNNLGIANNH